MSSPPPPWGFFDPLSSPPAPAPLPGDSPIAIARVDIDMVTEPGSPSSAALAATCGGVEAAPAEAPRPVTATDAAPAAPDASPTPVSGVVADHWTGPVVLDEPPAPADPIAPAEATVAAFFADTAESVPAEAPVPADPVAPAEAAAETAAAAPAAGEPAATPPAAAVADGVPSKPAAQTAGTKRAADDGDGGAQPAMAAHGSAALLHPVFWHPHVLSNNGAGRCTRC